MSQIVSLIVQNNLLTPAVASHAAQQAKIQKLSLISYLIKNNILNSDTIVTLFRNKFSFPIFDLNHYEKNWLEHSPLSREVIRNYRVLPLGKIDNVLQIAISDPTDQQTLDAIVFHAGSRVAPVIVAEDQLDLFLDKNYDENEINLDTQLNLLKKINLDDRSTLVQENIIQYDEPLIQFVDNIIKHALSQAVSDIHIEPYENNCRIRYRQHGVLYEVNEIPHLLASRVATRLKVIAKLDISERRLPQDGRFQLHDIDIRINTCPTLFGEKVVLRLLNSAKISLEINQLGLNQPQLDLFIQSISQPQGMILVTGPTGSGKTVTLYSAVHYLNKPEKNISTAEDPIEIRLAGINQVNINTKIGLHFSTILRAFLRQDPDIIMVGEIRDAETADIAIKAAQTGHLVLSTLHTNSAIEAITRLRSMGALSYNIASSVSLIIAQRLLRKLCEHCKKPEKLTLPILGQFGLPTNFSQHAIYRAHGCQKCLNGYTNRIAIYEFLPITENIAQCISADHSAQIIMQETKCTTLKQAGLKKLLQGVTSLTELNRVLQL